MAKDDFYNILGIPKNSTQDDIKKAYKNLARKYHPDKNKDNKAAEEQFKKISAAYAVLGDKEKRKLYDQFGIDGLRDGFDPSHWQGQGGFQNVWSNSGGFSSDNFGGFRGFGALEDIFDSLFGNAGPRTTQHAAWSKRGPSQTPGPQVKSTLNIDFLDMVLGRELQIVVPINAEQRKLKVTVPKGIENGKNIRLKGQGGSSPTNGPNGDLILEIKINEDPVYKRDGLNLLKSEQITLGTAYTGGSIPIDTPWGKLNLTIPPGTQSGQKLRLKGKGIEQNGKTGDMHVEIRIKLPSKRNKKIENAIEEIEKHY